MPADPSRRRSGQPPERTVQTSRLSWFTVIAGFCIAATGAYFLWIGHSATWLSVVQIAIGIWMLYDGGHHLLRRRRLLGRDD
ncbi:hypothetical protein Q7C18_09625 [Nesterenkonia sp. CL21]|uniref:hypothetical protein n=1 Tax=Nesterenkonia sp. CL21 TaxID=3064894 RepID=UPI0028788DC6|nr:hypothetical protein [Nesterenkonia sp. CL21]MDS2172956.1 hypothetical protein [Nesterenkonia sp. CL21]